MEGTIEHPAVGFRKIRVSRDTTDKWNPSGLYFFRIYANYKTGEKRGGGGGRRDFVITICGIFPAKKKTPNFFTLWVVLLAIISSLMVV